MAKEVTLPTFRLLYPVTIELKLLVVDTSIEYAVAFAEEFQLAVKPEQVINVAVVAAGADGVPGFNVTAKLLAALVPQVFPAVTVIFPPALPDVTVIEVEPWPLVINHPAGTAHV